MDEKLSGAPPVGGLLMLECYGGPLDGERRSVAPDAFVQVGRQGRYVQRRVPVRGKRAKQPVAQGLGAPTELVLYWEGA